MSNASSHTFSAKTPEEIAMPFDDRDFATQSERTGQEPAESCSHDSSPRPHRRRYGSGRFPGQHLPRQRPDRDEEGLEPDPHAHRAREVGEQAQWSYRLPGRGHERRFTGEVRYIGGREGGRRRAELAAVLDKLLRWAASEQQADQAQCRNDRDAA